MSYSETVAASRAPAPTEDLPPETSPDVDVRMVLENGIREISGEVRNSLDFHRSQEHGGEVSHVVLSGAALDLRASPRRCSFHWAWRCTASAWASPTRSS